MNVVVIMLDSLRPDHLGCYGNTEVKTPNLDRFASESVLFETAYAEFPNTIPSRTAFVSGIYTFPLRPWQALDPADFHVAELFAENGYHTAAFSDTPFNNGAHMDRGFAEFHHFATGKCLPPVDGRPVMDFSHAFFPPGYPVKEVNYYANTWTNRQICLEKHGMCPGEYFFSEVCQWLGARDNKPFFLWVDSFQPHEPWDSEEPYRSMYQPHLGYEGRYLPMPMAPDADKWIMPGDTEHIRALYKAGVTETDEYVGRVLRAIDDAGLSEDTLVFMLSDHGEPLMEHGLLRKFGYPIYDELARIVWMIRWPGHVTAGLRLSGLASNVDFLPTLFELTGLQTETRLDGRSLMPMVRGEAPRVRERVCLGAFNYRDGVRDERYKFIDNRGEKPDELYDMVADPRELNNLLPEQEELGRQMHRQLWEFHGPWQVKHSRRHSR
jgi:arylsulfatase A-like enzyme